MVHDSDTGRAQETVGLLTSGSRVIRSEPHRERQASPTNRVDPPHDARIGGQVLVAGGLSLGPEDFVLASAELYNPSTSTWAETGSMTVARFSADFYNAFAFRRRLVVQSRVQVVESCFQQGSKQGENKV
jgi:hypothetical protein